MPSFLDDEDDSQSSSSLPRRNAEASSSTSRAQSVGSVSLAGTHEGQETYMYEEDPDDDDQAAQPRMSSRQQQQRQDPARPINRSRAEQSYSIISESSPGRSDRTRTSVYGPTSTSGYGDEDGEDVSMDGQGSYDVKHGRLRSHSRMDSGSDIDYGDDASGTGPTGALGELDMGDDDDDGNDVKHLGRIWVKERGTVEIMPWEGDLIDQLFDKLEQQVSAKHIDSDERMLRIFTLHFNGELSLVGRDYTPNQGGN